MDRRLLVRLVVRAHLLPKWRWMVRVRPYALHWLEEHMRNGCAQGGSLAARDRLAKAGGAPPAARATPHTPRDVPKAPCPPPGRAGASTPFAAPPAASAPPGLHGCGAVDSGEWPRWRFVRASTSLPEGHVACVAVAHVVAVSEECKRRVCAMCFAVAAARLSISCADCEQCYYLSLIHI